ncbi:MULTISPECIES: 3-deoxy-manno-octulosonate-8-phosphatase KdsC [Shewanella]|uniref:3-deoxy-manno-octulosonate-8-phosphatase KdsC n=1 Tax=Shewanella TaxID=22 RepID=UPI00059FC896|nr:MULTISPECIES: 3-deoxy-manno-octulosonate-8-phosphatase KdsC [Shewanella]KIO36648.1 3-deoxy-D-manno-octulosonate 8-phosphate phosphatase [Shewanella sp. cp20]MCG9720014.1 3-deoxy-manno-octulosonate-8-phosphatase KdsC [Shewanella sp. Isolate7]MCG9745116.1 3-deoxy-manno-octulosonate-8-phosphatase KdsC [Shewanella sp. Isolate8]MCL2909980.1 3-deoxy-manno-octulosonate-8-phosphatase KdsC [Shewanella aquimarina]
MAHQGFYGPISDEVWLKAKQIKLLICDVDGVFSDGLVYMSNSGDELKTFHTRDGYGVRSLLTSDIPVAIITGRKSQIVEDRMTALGITHIYQGVDNKLEPYQELLSLYKVTPEEVAYIGDDMVDLPVMEKVGLSVCVADGHPYVRQHADMVTHIKGGHGALRELTDLILLSQDKFASAHGMSI